MKNGNFINTLKNMTMNDFIVIVCGIMAIVFGVLGFCGITNLGTETTLQVIISAIGIILLSLFVISTKNRATDKNASPDDYTTKWPPEGFDKYIENASALDIYGIELHTDTDRFFNLYSALSKKESRIRVILADPDGTVINMIKLRFPTQPSSIALSESIKTTIEFFKSLNVEVRTLDYLFPRKAYFVNQQNGDNAVFISNYTYQFANEKAVCLFHENKRKGEHNYYDLYKNEFEVMWDSAKEVE